MGVTTGLETVSRPSAQKHNGSKKDKKDKKHGGTDHDKKEQKPKRTRRRRKIKIRLSSSQRSCTSCS